MADDRELAELKREVSTLQDRVTELQQRPGVLPQTIEALGLDTPMGRRQAMLAGVLGGGAAAGMLTAASEPARADAVAADVGTQADPWRTVFSHGLNAGDGQTHIDAESDIFPETASTQKLGDSSNPWASITTDEVNDIHYVGASDDLQTIYNNADLADKVVITEDHNISSTFTISRTNGPTVEFRGSLVPAGDVTAVQVTGGGTTLIGHRNVSAVDDSGNNQTATSHGFEYLAKFVVIGVLRADNTGGHGHFLNQAASGDNLNSSVGHLSAGSNGGDGCRVENTSAGADNLNNLRLTLDSNAAGDVGVRVVDGIGCDYTIFSQNATNASVDLRGRDHEFRIYEEGGGLRPTITATQSFGSGNFSTAIPTDIPDSTTVIADGEFTARAAGARRTGAAITNPSANDNSEAAALAFGNAQGTIKALQYRGTDHLMLKDYGLLTMDTPKLSADPSGGDLDTGQIAFWVSDGTAGATGADDDVIMTVRDDGGTYKHSILFDFSAGDTV